jgi:RNA polymerase sigma-70 factor (ECF subfamily)
LFAIARNLVRDRWRRSRPETDITHVQHSLREERAGPEDIAVHRSEMQRLLGALEGLPDRQRSVIELRLAGLSMNEIAAIMGSSVNAVKTAQTRAFRHLRTELGEEGMTR